MNVSTKSWLLDLIDSEEAKLFYTASRPRQPKLQAPLMAVAMGRIEDARRLVKQMPEEPTT